MTFILQPWELLLMILAGLVNRQQQQVIEYLRTENAVLKEKLGGKRILLNDDQRRHLAVKAKILGRNALGEIATILTPDTLLRWHRRLVIEKWDYSERRAGVGRPRVRREILNIVLRMAGRILVGDTIESRERWPTSATMFPTRLWGAFSRNKASSRPRTGGGQLLGRHLSKPIGNVWRRSTSRQLKSGQREPW